MLADETIAQNIWPFHSGSFGSFGAGQGPAIALDASCAPHVLTAFTWVGTIYSSRDPATGWSNESPPLPSYSGSLVFGPTDAPLAVVHDGNFNSTLWTFTGQWKQIDQIPGQVAMYGQGLGIDANGALHAALWGPTNVTSATRAGSWSTLTGAARTFPPVLSVSPVASAHMAYWGWDGGTSQPTLDLSWWSPPSAPEVIATGGDNSIEQIGIATSAPDAENPAGKPHVIFGLSGAAAGNQIVYATRTGASQWTAVTIVQDSPSQNTCLASVPSAPGQTCSYDYTVDQPIGIAVSQSGDARVFYSSSRFTGIMTAQCSPENPPDAGPPLCNWIGPGAGMAKETDTLHVAWVAGGTVETTALTSTSNPSIATIAVDTTGAMHLALYEAVTTAGSTTISTRYLRIGRASP